MPVGRCPDAPWMRCGGEHAAYIIPAAFRWPSPLRSFSVRAAPSNPNQEKSGEHMASENVQVFNDINFEDEVLQSGETVLVDFTAAWCGPCKRLKPIVEEVAAAVKGKVKVGTLDIDEAPI